YCSEFNLTTSLTASTVVLGYMETWQYGGATNICLAIWRGDEYMLGNMAGRRIYAHLFVRKSASVPADE
ncbi:hypothetical protein, partial [Ginsengibacter hankyongi]|uniref:hypothetical protein n=1 Tax=Ginsengibacter hankyongi TaxID=2607284 RepID=UPI001F35D83A